MTNLTCIVCPMGCSLQVENIGGTYKVSGNSCKRGEKYGIEEMINPKRMITSTVVIKNAYLSCLPIKTSESVPKEMIFDIIEEIAKKTVEAPIKVGEIIIKNILDTGVDIVSCKTIDRI